MPETQMISLGDTQLNVYQAGSGQPLLFVHGFPLDHTMWDAQLEEFGRDYHVIAPDLRGFGASGLGSQAVSMASLADDLATLLDRLEVTRPVVLCGLSMGGYIAWQFWQRHQNRLAKLILCDTRAAADSAEAARGRRETAANILSDGTGELIEGMLPKLLTEPTIAAAPEQVAALRRVMAATDPRTIAAALHAMSERENMEPRLSEIAVPTLVLCGAEDAITPPQEMRQMAKAMPRARFVQIETAGHMAPLEQPVTVNRAIRRFLVEGSH